jgi:hypothetical protein
VSTSPATPLALVVLPTSRYSRACMVHMEVNNRKRKLNAVRVRWRQLTGGLSP